MQHQALDLDVPTASANRRNRHVGGSVSSAPTVSVAAAASDPGTLLSSSSEEGGARLSDIFSPVPSLRTPTDVNTKKIPSTNGKDFVIGDKPDDVFCDGDVTFAQMTQLMRDTELVNGPRSKYVASLFDDGENGTGRSVTMGNFRSGFNDFFGTEDDINQARQASLRQRPTNLNTRGRASEIDAQVLYPPSACVFVANLPEPVDDVTLEAAVTKTFSAFGTVFVKIRRDHRNMPFAFCQYTNNEDAREAMLRGRGLKICQRACRTEMVKANCKFTIYNRRGGAITLGEARQALGDYGRVKEAEYLQDRVTMGTPTGVVVEFSSFDATRDVVSAFRHHDKYRVEPYDTKRRIRSWEQEDQNEGFLEAYAAKRRSVYVGGLPANITEETLRAAFGTVGNIRSVEILDRNAHLSGPNPPRLFAFIEFERPDAPDVAIAELHGTHVGGGNPIIVERKYDKYDKREVRRLSSYQFMPRSAASNYGMAPDHATAANYRTASVSGMGLNSGTGSSAEYSHAYSRYAPSGNTASAVNPPVRPSTGAFPAPRPTSPNPLTNAPASPNPFMNTPTLAGLAHSTPMASALPPVMLPSASMTSPIWPWSPMYPQTPVYGGTYMPPPVTPYGHGNNNGGVGFTPQPPPVTGTAMPYYPGYVPLSYMYSMMGDMGPSLTAQHGGPTGGINTNMGPRAPAIAPESELTKETGPSSTA